MPAGPETSVAAFAGSRAAPAAQRRRILRLAGALEPDRARLAAWWSGTAIAELGGLTAGELAAAGQGEAVERFLRAVLCGERG